MSFFRTSGTINTTSTSGNVNLSNSLEKEKGVEKEKDEEAGLLAELESLEQEEGNQYQDKDREREKEGTKMQNQMERKKARGDIHLSFDEETKGFEDSGGNGNVVREKEKDETTNFRSLNSLGGPLYEEHSHVDDAAERDVEGRELAIETLRYRGMVMLRLCFALSLTLILTASVLGCIYGWIYTNSKGRYVPGNGNDDDPYGNIQDVYSYTDWQNCINSNYVAVDAGLPAGKLLLQNQDNNFNLDAAAFAGQSLIFLGLAFKACYMALHDLYLLPYTMTVAIITLIGMTLYRPVNPIIPMVNNLTPTLFSFIHYINDGMYDNVLYDTGSPLNKMGKVDPSICTPAITLNKVFLIAQFITVAVNLVVLCIQLYAAYTWTKLRMPTYEVPYVMNGYQGCLYLSVCSFLGYITTVILKEIASWTTQDIYVEAKWENIFPYVRPTLDVVGLFMLITVTTCIQGWCRQDTEAFKSAAFTAFIYLCLSYPLIVNNFEAFHLYGFWGATNCEDVLKYIDPSQGALSKEFTIGQWQYLLKNGSDEQIETICTCFRGSLLAQFIQFVCMHMMIIASLFVVRENIPAKNPTLASMRSFRSIVSEGIHDPNEPLLVDNNQLSRSLSASMGGGGIPTIDGSLASATGAQYRLTRASRGTFDNNALNRRNSHIGHRNNQSSVMESPAIFDPMLE